MPAVLAPGRGGSTLGRVTTIDAFRQSLAAAEPPAGATPALQALWWAARGDWRRAHECVQAPPVGDPQGERDCDRVHAHLHRQEGDLANAGYWYRRAGAAVPGQSLDEEWVALVGEMLGRG